jgi:integrase
VARTINRLSARRVEAEKKPGYHADGNGLYLQVTNSGTKSWVFRYMVMGRSREMGLGALDVVSLEQARIRRDEHRRLLAEGRDPLEVRDVKRLQHQLEKSRNKTFSECATAFMDAHRCEWKNAKHAAQWQSTLDTYAHPEIGSFPVHSIDTPQIHAILRPIWNTKRETATRLRGRLEKILDWATALNFRSGPNPARWREHLDQVFKDQRRNRIKHHAALPFEHIGQFMKRLRDQPGTAARALELTILTVARTGETIGASPEEFNVTAAMWIVPGERMKGGRTHRKPLSIAAVELVRGLPTEGRFAFPGRSPLAALSNMAMLKLMQRMGYGEYTVHGFRSTFRDWAAELTDFSRDVCEMALAHAVADQTEAAYRRGDLFEKRRQLMEAWAHYCANNPLHEETVEKNAGNSGELSEPTPRKYGALV